MESKGIKPMVSKRGRQKKADAEAKAAKQETVSQRPRRFKNKRITHEVLPHDQGEVGAEPYWIGTFDDSPKQNITLAGINFPNFTQDVFDVEGQYRTERVDRRGMVVYLTKRQVLTIMKECDRLCFRFLGRQREDGTYGRASMIDKNIDGKRFGTDESPAHFVYLYPLDKAVSLGPNWREGDNEPPSLAEFMVESMESLEKELEVVEA